MLNITEQKRQIRQEMRKILKTQDKLIKKKADEKIFRNLCKNTWVQQADLILCYYAMPEEPATQEFISEMLRQGKKIALPKCDMSYKGNMMFYEIKNLFSEEIQSGAFGIPEPVNNYPIELTSNSIILVPALAFTRQGKRLGRGGGYYDRFLYQYPELHKIGICYDSMLMQNLPCELHDCYVDVIITESNGG
ncbi:MAG: 5-formyltetrahydrofolate cyclo-ligase [Oscillospiraceae bacterium]|nr:5-formyltetrahydrofolate cyclo-ligase [Ruminococcus sp.]MDE6707212.1 5-formyltetrahydrofolate cyclo-ligase [Oscillospiraceae bacterium]